MAASRKSSGLKPPPRSTWGRKQVKNVRKSWWRLLWRRLWVTLLWSEACNAWRTCGRLARKRWSTPPARVGAGSLLSVSHHVRQWWSGASKGGGAGNCSGMSGRTNSGGTDVSSSRALANALRSSSKVERMCCLSCKLVADGFEPGAGGAKAPVAATARRMPMTHRPTCAHAEPGGARGGRRGR